MTLISKAAAGLSIFSSIADMHNTAMIDSRNAAVKASSDACIANAIGTGKANSVSYKDAQRKNWLLRKNFFLGYKEGIAAIKGYVGSFFQTGARYLPKFVVAAVAMISKNKKISSIATLGLAGLEVADFITNASNLTQRTDYLK